MLIFGFIYLKYNNIWYPTIMHIAINSSSVIVTCTEAAWIYAVFAVLAIIGIVVLVKKYPELKLDFLTMVNDLADKCYDGEVHNHSTNFYGTCKGCLETECSQ